MSNNLLGARRALLFSLAIILGGSVNALQAQHGSGAGGGTIGGSAAASAGASMKLPGKKPVKPATGNTTKPKTGTKPTAPDNSAQMDDAMSLADDARQAGRNEAAERGYLLASKLVPSDPRPYLGLGHIYYNQKKYAEAEKYYARAASLARSRAPRDRLLRRRRDAPARGTLPVPHRVQRRHVA